MKHSIKVEMPTIRKVPINVLPGLTLAWLILGVLTGCDNSAPFHTENKFSLPGSATLVHQADGREAMVISNAQAEEGPIGMAREVQLPRVLEATGQVTFDDKLVSTIISRLTGRIEEMLSSQWQMVKRGEPVMKVYSPDYMSAEAEYLAATSGANQAAQTQTFGLPPAFGVAASLKEAAIRKLDLLGFSRADIAAIRAPNPTVWVTAPISGIIVSKNVVRGQAINPGDQLLALATLQRVWITADIYQDDLSRVYVGQSVEAVTASYPGKVFKGTVQKISPALDPNIHTLQLRCEVENPGSLLKPQMLARMRLLTSPRQALIIPQSALVFDGDSYFAFIISGPDTVERRPVKIADWSEPGYFCVVSGIGPSDRFLVTETLKFDALWRKAGATAS